MKKRIRQHFWTFFHFRNILLNIGICLVYILLGKLGLSLAFVNPSATAIWAPTGIALAVTLLFGRRVLPAIFLGAFVVNIITAGGAVSSLGIAFGNTLEAVAGAYLVERFAHGLHAFNRVLDIFTFIILAGLVSTAISASVGVTTLILGGLATVQSALPVWITWWMGDMGGNLIIAPLLLVWATHLKFHVTPRGTLHFLASIISISILTEIVFLGILPYPYFCIPLAVWIAFWFGRRGATITTLLVGIIAIVNTLHGMGPFAQGFSINQSLILLQVFLGIFSLTALTFATTLLEYRKTETIITSQEKRFKALIENSFDAIVLIDATSRISYASPSFEKIVGYSPQETVGKIGFDLVYPEDRPEVMKQLAQLVLKPRSTLTVQYRTLRKDKKIIWVEATGTNLLLEPSISAVVVNFRDITDKKYHEEEIKNNEKRFRSLVENSGEGIALIDKNRKIIYTTATITELLGYTQEEYEKKDPSSIIHPDDIKVLQKQSEVILKKPNASVSLQYRIMHKNGTYRWFDVLATNLLEDKAVHSFVVKFRDVTDQKIAEETVRREKVEDEALLASIGEGLIATDEFGRITLTNEAAEMMLKIKKEDLMGKLVTDVIAMEDEKGNKIPLSERPMTKVLASGKTTITSPDTYYTRGDQTRFPVIFTLTPVILDKKVIGTIEVFRDITEEKAVDKTKTEFVSLASHQLRTPLATINWYLEELIKTGTNFTLKQGNYVKEVYAASRRMVELINALLNTSRLELGTFVVEPVKTDIAKIVQQITKDLTPKTEEKHITIKEEYTKSIPLMNADPKLLTIIIQNLLANAIKYTKEKDTIILRVIDTKKEFVISIQDNGYGIPKKQQSQIFNKLFRADNARIIDPEGSGLGLYIVKSIVTVTGGKIWFESEENKGTSFFVSFPYSGMQQKVGQKQLL